MLNLEKMGQSAECRTVKFAAIAGCVCLLTFVITLSNISTDLGLQRITEMSPMKLFQSMRSFHHFRSTGGQYSGIEDVSVLRKYLSGEKQIGVEVLKKLREKTYLPPAWSDVPVVESGDLNLSEDDEILKDHSIRDRWEFNKLVKHHWPVGKPKGAIYFLFELKRMNMLKKAIDLLDKNYNSEYNYPIILFHEENIGIEDRKVVRNFTKSLIFFQEINMTLPKFNLIEDLVPIKDHCVNRPISYRHMCRFNAMLVYNQPIFNNLEYYIRLDTDSEILRPVGYDILRKLRDLKKVHGYIWMREDKEECVYGLWDAARKYADHEDIKPYFLDEWPNRKVYYNNFEMSRLDFWRSEDVQGYLRYIDRLGGIYYLRWGDNPIKALAVAIFLPKDKTYYFDDIGYKHTTFHRP